MSRILMSCQRYCWRAIKVFEHWLGRPGDDESRSRSFLREEPAYTDAARNGPLHTRAREIGESLLKHFSAHEIPRNSAGGPIEKRWRDLLATVTDRFVLPPTAAQVAITLCIEILRLRMPANEELIRDLETMNKRSGPIGVTPT